MATAVNNVISGSPDRGQHATLIRQVKEGVSLTGFTTTEEIILMSVAYRAQNPNPFFSHSVFPAGFDSDANAFQNRIMDS